MNVAIFHGERKSLEQLFYYDLILMEPPDSMNLHTYQALNRIRLGSRAPLLLLTDDHPVEWSINAFRCGADAILPWSTSNDVIVARCKALLRRWLPHSH
ncbi:hypothetical protein KFU94_49835 [Chloroflexi bacterium TSY]|nr:hypothetical protein [Chloroflexi bacterium TSY]